MGQADQKSPFRCTLFSFNFLELGNLSSWSTEYQFFFQEKSEIRAILQHE